MRLVSVRFLVFSGIFAFLLSVASGAVVAESASSNYSEKGADTCIKCHDEDNDYPIFPIFFSKHGVMSDSRTPMAQLQCESCHGPIGEHGKKKLDDGEKRAHIISFGKNKWAPAAVQNDMCLQCHKDYGRLVWKGSAHESQGMVCTQCHVSHRRKDPMRSASGQMETCTKCHAKQVSEFQLLSAHPVKSGVLKCSSCHNPHGGFSDKLMARRTRNDVCTSCHAEKRGPFLWNHPPAIEDCTICHENHGSIHPALLKKRPPLLCQQCHSINDTSLSSHSRQAYTADDLGAGGAAPLMAKGCVNCHSQVHGSNHPSGVKLLR